VASGRAKGAAGDGFDPLPSGFVGRDTSLGCRLAGSGGRFGTDRTAGHGRGARPGVAGHQAPKLVSYMALPWGEQQLVQQA